VATPAESDFQIRVSLMDSEPLIWRRVRLSGETTLEELHDVIQVVMD
jgi:hypothetical protein